MELGQWLTGTWPEETAPPDTDGMRYQTLCLRLDHFDRLKTSRSLVLTSFDWLLARSAALFPEGQVCLVAENRIGILFASPAFPDRNALAYAFTTLSGEAAERALSLTAGLGSRAMNAQGVPESYRNAETATTYRMVYGFGQFIAYEDIAGRVATAPPYPDAASRAVVSAFQKGDSVALENQLSILVSACYSQSVMFGRAFMTHLLLLLYQAIPPEKQLETDFVTVYNALHDCEHMHEQFLLLNRFCLESMSAPSNEKRREQADALLRYVADNLANPDLSITSMAEHVSLSTNSVRSLFRELDLPSPRDYITGKRIELACELLKTTQLTAKEIGEQVGFLDSRYFYAVFKKATGMTAFEYRSHIRNQ